MAKHHSKDKDKKDCREKGGRVGMKVSGNPDVFKEADDFENEPGKKHGGKVKMKKHHRNSGGKVVGLMTGGGVRSRLDRPGRKRGGAVGATSKPLSSAHNASGGADGSSSPTDTYGGTPA